MSINIIPTMKDPRLLPPGVDGGVTRTPDWWADGEGGLNETKRLGLPTLKDYESYERRDLGMPMPIQAFLGAVITGSVAGSMASGNPKVWIPAVIAGAGIGYGIDRLGHLNDKKTALSNFNRDFPRALFDHKVLDD